MTCSVCYYICSDTTLLNIQRKLISLDSAHIEELLPIPDGASYGKTVQDFLEPWGQKRITLIHIASYSGWFEVLQRAHDLKLNLYLTDDVGRCALHYASSEGHVHLVKWLIERADSHAELHLQDYSGRTALHLAVIGKHVDVVELLVDARVDVNIRDASNKTPLHLAWVNVHRNDTTQMQQYRKIVETLLSSPFFTEFIDEPKDKFEMTVLHGAAHLNSPIVLRQLLGRGVAVSSQCQYNEMTTPLHITAKHGFHTTMQVLLRNRCCMPWMMNMRDEMGNTPLHVAISKGHLNCFQALMKKRGSLLTVAGDGRTAIDILFQEHEYPADFLAKLFDGWIYTSDNGCTVYLDFDVLAPMSERQMAVVSALMSAVTSMKQMIILQHPLVEAFLRLKWRRLGYFFVGFVIFQGSFIACLSAYGHLLLLKTDGHSIPRRMVLIGASVMLCQSLAQLFTTPKYYARRFETWFSVFSTLICFVVTTAGEFGFDNADHSDETPSWILQSISVAILLACIKMMLLIGQFPAWGYYGLMFSTVLKNVLKVFLAVVWVIIGFALSFSILFHYNDQFDNQWKSFVRTVIMMMGEYEYSDLFETMDKNNLMRNNTNHSSLLPVTSRIIFLLFGILASIVLLNLMIGLAVIDIQDLLNEGLIQRLMKQAELVTHLEQVTSHLILRCRLVPWFLKTRLNSLNTIPVIIPVKSSAKLNRNTFGITKKLVERLFDVAAKNRSLERKTQAAATAHDNYGDSLIESLSHVEEGIKKLKRDVVRIQEMQSPRCNIARPEEAFTVHNSITST